MNIVGFRKKEQRILISSAYGESQSINFKFEKTEINDAFSLVEFHVFLFDKKINEPDLMIDNRVVSPNTSGQFPWWILAKDKVVLSSQKKELNDVEIYKQFVRPNTELLGISDIGKIYASGLYDKHELVSGMMWNDKNPKTWLIMTLDHNRLFDLVMDQSFITVSDKINFNQMNHADFNTQDGEKNRFSGIYSFGKSKRYLPLKDEG